MKVPPARLAVLVLSLPLLGAAGRLHAGLDEEIGEATDHGIEYLLKAIEAKQAETGEHDGQRGGKIALETYALVVAGVSVDHPLIKKNLDSLNGMSLDHTYSVACYAFALDAAISQLQADAALAAPSQRLVDPNIGSQYRPRLEAAINALIRIRRDREGDWNYTSDRARFDNSNTQFAVLGLGLGSKHRVNVPREVWEEVALHFIQGQKKRGPEVMERLEFYPDEERGEGKRDRVNIVDRKSGEKVEKGKKAEKKGREGAGKDKEKDKDKGSPTVARPADPKDTKAEPGPEAQRYFARGWDYDNKGGESWNMTCGGLSSMILAAENLRGKVPPDLQAQIDKSVRDGYAWVMSNWSPGVGGDWGYYGLYSLEKVADLGEVKKFGSHDWFQETARIIIGAQRLDGSWPGGNPNHVRWNSAFALLILNRATSLIAQGRSVKPGRMVLTGAIRRDKEISDDRNWVFIPDYEREFHLPSLLRQVKLRPTRKLLAILELALKHYPEEQRGYLVANLVKSLQDQKHKSVRTFIDGELKRITGTEYQDPEQYMTWYRRWVDVHRIGTEAKDPEGWLAKFYPKTAKSLPLKKKILWAVGRCRNQDLAPVVIEDLAHEDADLRLAAYETLSLLRLSKEPIPAFDPKAEGPARDQQVALIRDWYAKRKA